MLTGKRNLLQALEDAQYNFLSIQEKSDELKQDKDKKILVPPLNNTNYFATIDFDAHIFFTKNENANNHMLKTMTVSELNTLHTVSELKRSQKVTILAVTDKNRQLACFLMTQNRSNLPFIEGFAAWPYDF